MDPVEEQYEAHPYPARDPRAERERLVTGSPSRLAEIDHYVFGGGPRPDPLRVLIAGGGTGDGLVQLAVDCARHGARADIHYLDRSRAARTIAEARIAARGLAGVTFHSGAIEEAGRLGRFDYVDCCGVLHHLEDPAAGLAALAGVLAQGGGMGLMVYGALGRAGVYELQEALEALTPRKAHPLPARIAAARALLAALPPTNGFRRNPFLADHLASEAGLVDLLLHARDRAFRIEGLVELIEGAGLEVASLVEPLAYEPELYLADEALKARAALLPQSARWGLAERLAGSMTKHIAYVVRRGEGRARPEPADDMVPVLIDLEAEPLGRLIASGRPLRGTLHGLKLAFALPPLAGRILAGIDGVRPLGALLAGLEPRPDRQAFERAFAEAFRVLGGLNKLLLRRAV